MQNDKFCPDLFTVPRFPLPTSYSESLSVIYNNNTVVFTHVFDLRHFENLELP